MKNKKVRFSLGEEEWINVLVEQMGCPYLTAVDYVIQYKRDMAKHYILQGNDDLACQLLDEIGETIEDIKQI